MPEPCTLADPANRRPLRPEPGLRARPGVGLLLIAGLAAVYRAIRLVRHRKSVG